MAPGSFCHATLSTGRTRSFSQSDLLGSWQRRLSCGPHRKCGRPVLGRVAQRPPGSGGRSHHVTVDRDTSALLPPHQPLVPDPMRLIRVRPLPPLEILHIRLVIPLGVDALGGCWDLTTGILMGTTESNRPVGSVLNDVPCQMGFDTNTASRMAFGVYARAATPSAGPVTTSASPASVNNRMMSSSGRLLRWRAACRLKPPSLRQRRGGSSGVILIWPSGLQSDADSASRFETRAVAAAPGAQRQCTHAVPVSHQPLGQHTPHNP